MIRANLPNTLIVIAGPTAVGKTACSIEIAKHFETVIISADSRQFFKEMKIGTATPSPEELNEAKHYFIGHLSINDYYNVSRYEHEVIDLLQNLFAHKNQVILTGGSGLYIDAICKGIDDFPEIDKQIRENINMKYRKYGIDFLREELMRLDTEYFEVVDRNNPNRLKRAIEVCYQTGKKYSEQRTNKSKSRNFKIIRIGLNRERQELFYRINQRVDQMIDHGLLDEAKSLYPYKGENALNTVGYKELFAHFDGDLTLSEAIDKIKTNTRRYAKRQLTWLKKDDAYHWFHPDNIQGIIQFIDQESDS